MHADALCPLARQAICVRKALPAAGRRAAARAHVRARRPATLVEHRSTN